MIVNLMEEEDEAVVGFKPSTQCSLNGGYLRKSSFSGLVLGRNGGFIFFALTSSQSSGAQNGWFSNVVRW